MLQELINYIIYDLFSLDATSKFISSLNFFIYDTVKILFLLFFMIFIISFLRTYISDKKVKRMLSHKHPGLGNLIASLFGTITPFCSCSSIPIFFSFLKMGVPIGITFSFLITSPLVNEYLVAIMFGAFGWKITLAYIIAGVIIGTVSGMILGKMNLEKYIDTKFKARKFSRYDKKYDTIKDRLYYGYDEAISIVRKLWIWILIGVGIGALIHNYVPDDLVTKVVMATGVFAVPIATLIGVPMYGSCAAIVPIALALFQKGVPIGTALAFMMAVSALSIPQAVMLKSAMRTKLIVIFYIIVTIGIMIVGYVMNGLVF